MRNLCNVCKALLYVVYVMHGMYVKNDVRNVCT